MLRFFSLDGQILTMDSHLEDEFGELQVITSGSIQATEINSISQTCPLSVDMETRIQEMRHFLKVFLLFNPVNQSNHVSEKKLSEETSFPF